MQRWTGPCSGATHRAGREGSRAGALGALAGIALGTVLVLFPLAARAADLLPRRATVSALDVSAPRISAPKVARGAPAATVLDEPAVTGTVTRSDEAASEVDVPARLPEFLRRSGSRPGGPANELNTGDARSRTHLPEGSVADMLAGRDLYHGNYCGPGNRGGAPVDALDAVCQRHDACYGAAGHRSCGCDRALQRGALTVAASPALSRELRTRATSVAESTLLMACSEP